MARLENLGGFPDDAFSRYLAGFCFEMIGDGENAALSYRYAATVLSNAAAGVTVDSMSVDYWAYVEGLQPAKLALKASSTSLGDLTMSVTMTRYNQPVTIAPPPRDQVKSG